MSPNCINYTVWLILIDLDNYSGLLLRNIRYQALAKQVDAVSEINSLSALFFMKYVDYRNLEYHQFYLLTKYI